MISKRQKEQCEILLTELRKNSITTVSCQKAGIPRLTLYRWKKDDPELMDMVDEAMSEGKCVINAMAESVIIKSIREGNVSASKYYLSHNHERYRTGWNRFPENDFRKEIDGIREKFKSFFSNHFRNKK